MTDAVPRLSSALADRYRIERELGRRGMATAFKLELRRFLEQFGVGMWGRARARRELPRRGLSLIMMS